MHALLRTIRRRLSPFDVELHPAVLFFSTSFPLRFDLVSTYLLARVAPTGNKVYFHLLNELKLETVPLIEYQRNTLQLHQ
jgi:hypothetical protein